MSKCGLGIKSSLQIFFFPNLSSGFYDFIVAEMEAIALKDPHRIDSIRQSKVQPLID